MLRNTVINEIVFHSVLCAAPAVTSGVRYILAGFCEYGDIGNTMNLSEENHAAFMALYQPQFDGTAAQYGFRTGDMIVGLEVCEEADQMCDASDVDCDATAGPVVRRRKVDISGSTSDEQWIEFAQSCEQLQTGSDTVLFVRRRLAR